MKQKYPTESSPSGPHRYPFFGLQKSLTACLLLVMFIATITGVGCRPSAESQINSIQTSAQSEEEKILSIAKIIVGDPWKEASLEPNPDGGKNLYISFGGATALTFDSKDQYQMNRKLETALLTHRILYHTQGLNLNTLRISITKPLFVQNASGNDESMQEFEIFRVAYSKSQWEKLGDFAKKDPANLIEKNQPNPELLAVLERMVAEWKEELNEFHRIQVD